jgi:large subunit ribosomal protein L3
MINTILGSKQNMGATFIEGTRVAVTYVKAGPCVVTQIKTEDKDGYWGVQLGFSQKKIKNISKQLQGHFKKALQDTKIQSYKESKVAPRYLREVRLGEATDLNVGDEITLTQVLKKGDVIAVTGISKGKGFAGVVKRHHFAGGPKTHGQSDRPRAPGSIGQGTTPGRVLKGKKMAGRMGSDTVTIKNLIVVDIDKEKDILAISGPVPGTKESLLIVKKIKSGSLEDLVEEAPEVVEQVESSEPEAPADKAPENIKEGETK